MNDTALVTGSSTGIGLEISLALARNGIYTFATMRNLQKKGFIEGITNKESLPLRVLEMDVNDGESVRRTIKDIVRKNKKIDILVNNAGYGLFGALEDISLNEIKEQFETNYFGAVRAIKGSPTDYEETAKWYNYKHYFHCRSSRYSRRMCILKL